MPSLVLQCAPEAGQILIKEESAEEDMWKSNSEDKLSEFKLHAGFQEYTENIHCSAQTAFS